jgi:ATP-binding cassette, subfamily C (CFTR/MRP), member 1
MRAVRTSFLLNTYLPITVIFDIARSRSYSLSDGLGAVSAIFGSRVGIKLVLAVLEARSKKHSLLEGVKAGPPEATSGVYSRALFWWQNQLFRKGFNNILTVDDLFQLDKHLQSDYLHHRLQRTWQACMFPFHQKVSRQLTHQLEPVVRKSSNSLFAATLKRLKWSVLAVVPPRACLIAFNFCQPFLIDRAITYSQGPATAQTKSIGYGLIAAYGLVYIGIAVCSE